jgi:hypothetical protein
VEIWFSILAGKALAGTSFASVTELKAHIEAFIDCYYETANPFRGSMIPGTRMAGRSSLLQMRSGRALSVDASHVDGSLCGHFASQGKN